MHFAARRSAGGGEDEGGAPDESPGGAPPKSPEKKGYKVSPQGNFRPRLPCGPFRLWACCCALRSSSRRAQPDGAELSQAELSRVHAPFRCRRGLRSCARRTGPRPSQSPLWSPSARCPRLLVSPLSLAAFAFDSQHPSLKPNRGRLGIFLIRVCPLPAQSILSACNQPQVQPARGRARGAKGLRPR